MEKNKYIEFQREQLQQTIQRIGEELDDAIDIQLRDEVPIDSEAYKVQQKRITDLGNLYDKLIRLYEETYNKPIEEPISWKDKIDWTKVASTAVGAGLLIGGDVLITGLIHKWQNQGDLYNERNKHSSFSRFISKIF